MKLSAIKNSLLGAAVTGLAVLWSAPLMAQAAVGPDLSDMTDAFAVDTVVTAILAIGAAAMSVWLAIIGYRYVKRMISSV